MKEDVENYPPTDGNRAYASLHLMPSTILSKEGFLDFCSIRRFPLLSLRKLCGAMKRGGLPLQHEPIQKLVRQTLYQVGGLYFNDRHDLKFQWREFDIEEICRAYVPILQHMSSVQKECPYLYKASPMIGEISNYFLCLPGLQEINKSVKHLKEIPLTLAEAAIKWAKEYDDDIIKASPEMAPSLRSKQVILYRTAVMCVINGEMNEDSASIVLECIVQSQNKFVIRDEESDERKALKDFCEYLLTWKLDEYLNLVVKQNGEILSKALKTVLSSAPEVLNWERENDSHVSFSARDSTGDCYSINTLSGVILVNGLPPHQLPSSITEDALFRKCFLDNNFEVVMKSGYFETTHPIFGCYYKFHKNKGDTLVVQESIHEKLANGTDVWNDCLELLDLTNTKHWDKFPLKLQTSFSHWVSRNDNTLVLRPFDFRRREIFFLKKGDSEMKNVPKYLDRRDDLRNIRKKYGEMDHIIIHETKFLEILERFEMRCMMFTKYHPDEKSLQYSVRLNRFALGFQFTKESSNFECSEITGYHLRPNQHLSGHFHGLHQYLVLDSDEEDRKTKVLVPFGDIKIESNHKVTIKLVYSLDGKLHATKEGVEEHMHFFTYDIHPRFHTLSANNLSARLFLAGLYIATSSLVQDSNIGTTGEAQAIKLLRQCMINRQLSEEEKHCLYNVKYLSKARSPTSYLLCCDIEQNSCNYSFLYRSCKVDTAYERDDEIRFFSDECSAYMAAMRKPMDPRLYLNEQECQRIFGSPSNQYGWHNEQRVVRERELIVLKEECPVKRSSLFEIQECMGKLWRSELEEEKPASPFPLYTCTPKTPLEEQVFDELKRSWQLHLEGKKRKTILKENTFDTLDDLKKFLADYLKHLESYLDLCLNKVPEFQFSANWSSKTHQFLKLIGILPSATKSDFLSIACDKAMIKKFNPLLSAKSQDTIYDAILFWLELCVEHDKISFLLSFKDKGLSSYSAIFVDELVTKRMWNVKEHPYWLVFEAEQGIRIRPEQYSVAYSLIKNNGTAVQLNMGRGKTRVILPMLVMFWSFSKEYTHTPRLCIPSKLLREGCDYFHRVLSGSTLEIRLFLMPFQRDVELDTHETALLYDMVNHCRAGRGFFLVAPEHLLSMDLKTKELHLSKNFTLSSDLQKVTSNSWCTIIDEIDDVLHHRFQLVYSIGTVQPLPQGKYRWESIESVLQVLKKVEMIGLKVTVDKNMTEAFPIIMVDDNMDIHGFRHKVSEALLNDPPLCFKWLKDHSKRDLISSVITQTGSDTKELQHLSQEHLHSVLCLRGLLAFDILLHCLKKRHRVDYGVNKGGKKQLAVPFRGADTPSQRAEFSHPDCAIAFTILSYYDHGLSRGQTQIAFELLCKKGKNAKATIYNEWLETSKQRMLPVVYESVSNVNKIDMSNKAQFEILFKHFYKNPGTINLWLNSCVFPNESDQYPQRLVSNSWHISHHNQKNQRCVGFSGTNDNHLILPLHLKQYLPWNTEDTIWSRLLSTNGRMLDIMMQKTSLCIELDNGKVSQSLLSYIKSAYSDKNIHIDALIDSGALLAGLSNTSVAKYILKECLSDRHSVLNGVTFFDEDRKSWVILEVSGRCMEKDLSPLLIQDTFVLFDEPHCRGVDLKLRPDAVALLTLGQNICKDKVMQAAGRMRQLEENQSIVIVGEPKIFQEIRRVNKLNGSKIEVLGETLNTNLRKKGFIDKEDVNISHVLSWVMHNTVESIWKGLGTWSDQGIFYASSTKPEDFVFDEKLDLNAFYGQPIKEISVDELALSARSYYTKRSSGGDDKVIDTIIKRCNKLGSLYGVMRTGVDEECEREMQREIEEEEEEEVEYSKVVARSETDWNYDSIFSSESIKGLPIKTFNIVHIMTKHVSCQSLSRIKWSNKVICTENFMITIQCDGHLDEFLRIPDSMVHFPCGTILLLSDREANKVLPLFQKKIALGILEKDYHFGHYPFESEQDQSKFLRCGKNHILRDEIACSLKLFNGETQYPRSQFNTLKEMLSGAMNHVSSGNFNMSKSSGEPEYLVMARRKNTELDRSDLEMMCSEIACQAEKD